MSGDHEIRDLQEAQCLDSAHSYTLKVVIKVLRYMYYITLHHTNTVVLSGIE